MKSNANMNVIHIKDAPSKFNIDSNYVYIGRGSKWGNPYIMKNSSDAERTRVINEYRQHILSNVSLRTSLHELKGKTLVCFCKPKACHGDVLVELVNALLRGDN